jgi:hypothetical protein
MLLGYNGLTDCQMSSISAMFIIEKIGDNGASRSDLGHYLMEITHSEGLKG